MAQIQSATGLMSGVDIEGTVNALMKVAARPRDLVVERNENLQSEQVAISSLSATLLNVQYAVAKLGRETVYDQRTVSSSNSSVLSATMTGDPVAGNYPFTVLQTATQHQLLSGGVASDSEALDGGTFTFRFGSHVGEGVGLDALNGGEGLDQGSIRITDRSGSSAEIDLSTARTVDDVLEAINSNTAIRVTATAEGGHLRLEDETGQTLSNLKVEEVGSGTTAASLGLADVDVAADAADGGNVFYLADDVDLDLLNDGSGVVADRALEDVEYALRDGTTGTIDLSPIIPGSSEVDEDKTLGDVLARINAAAPGKLKAEIAPDGDRLLLTDLTEGTGSFSVESAGSSTALADLGLDGEAVDGVITGRDVLGGLKTVLLSSLGGGHGLGELGRLDLTDRSGAGASVDLSGAETLDDVIAQINAAGVGIEARVNDARNGVALVDTTGSTAGNLIVANGDGTSTADKLQIAVDDAVGSVNSGDLHLQVVSYGTRLGELNGGSGVAVGNFTIYDTEGNSATIHLDGDEIETAGDVIRAINRQGLMVRAELNETGDGVRLVDLAHGAGTLAVEEGGGTTAADLHLLGDVEQVEIGGETTQVIDGSATFAIDLEPSDSLTDLRDKINQFGAGVTASVISDGSAKPYRLVLQSDSTGAAGEILVDTSAIDLSFQQTAGARDALLVFGDARSVASSVLLSSPTNTFADVISGVELQARDASPVPVIVSVESTDGDLVDAVQTMVDNYNTFRDTLEKLTAYDPEGETTSVLTGDATALRLDTDLPYLLSGSFSGAGPIKSLGELGISLNDAGRLEFDAAKFRQKYAKNPEAVEQFFRTEDAGLADKFGNLIDRLAGDGDSLLSGRLDVLGDKIESNRERIALLDARLAGQKERLLSQFYQMELAIAKLETNLNALDSIVPISYYTRDDN